MLTDDEKRFLVYWEKNRDRQAGLPYQLTAGLPLGALFALPILVNFLLGRFWYRRADAIGTSQFNPLVLVLAVFIISVFIGFFYKKFRWDQNEQKFKELKYKEKVESKEDREMSI